MDTIDRRTAPAEQARFCPSCGTEAAESNFCPACGHNMGFAANRTIADPSLQVHVDAPPPPKATGRSRMVLLAACGALGVLAVVVAVLVLTGTKSPSGAQKATYTRQLGRAVRPLVASNTRLSASLGALTASASSQSAASRAVSQAQAALNTASGAVGTLSVPGGEQSLSRSVQQALTAENGYLQAVSSTLQTPSGASAGQLQTLATGAQTALVALNSVIPTAGASVSGASTLASWAHSKATSHPKPAKPAKPAARAATTATATVTTAVVPAAAASGVASGGGGSGGASATNAISCGNGLYAGTHTSCPFAQDVQQAYDNQSSVSAVVTAYSPVTGQTYQDQCAPDGSGNIECVGIGDDNSLWWN